MWLSMYFRGFYTIIIECGLGGEGEIRKEAESISRHYPLADFARGGDTVNFQINTNSSLLMHFSVWQEKRKRKQFYISEWYVFHEKVLVNITSRVLIFIGLNLSKISNLRQVV